MSYILDALRKADAERRGVPPPPTGLTEPAVLIDSDPDADLPAARARPWVWVLGGVAIALAAAAGWTLWHGASSSPTTVATAPVVAAQTVPTPVSPSPAPAPAPRPEPSADALPHFPPPLPDPPKQEPPKPEPPKPEPRPVAVEATPVKPPLPPGIAPVPPAPEAGTTNRVYNVSELPDSVRRDLPKFNVGGAMYSERAADRMVVLNGQVFHEGDALGKGLVLKQIRLKSTVVEFRGYRIEIAH